MSSRQNNVVFFCEIIKDAIIFLLCPSPLVSGAPFILALQMKRSSLKRFPSHYKTSVCQSSKPCWTGKCACACSCVRFFSRVPSLRPFDAELHCLAEPQEIEREDQAERQRENRRTPGLSGTRHTEMNSPGVTRGRRGARGVRASAWWRRSRS